MVAFSSGRTFRVWRYGVGHSQLLLRAVPDEVDSACLDLLFEGVSAMKMATRFESMEITLAGTGEAREILEISGLADVWGERSLALALRSREVTGLVLCQRASALLGGTDPFEAPGVSAEQSEIWSSG
ncbi:hypothetical protein ABZT02_27370 [Streptomyces sp. NPDC005402]|uniref:hypothetical protein n=1 Tax=Streptomyces sp. NPDC005402 TaxID=3155338 RepID=UPI0033BE106A